MSGPDHSHLGGIFDLTGVTRGPDGIKRYHGLPRNLVQMLRASADRQPGAEAVVETGAENAGGPRLSYAQLWDRSARVAGGLRGLGVQRGDRVAIQLGNGVDWVLAFFGAVLVSGVRSVAYGGAPIAPDLVARLAEAFPQARLGNGFGLTETSSVSTFLPHEFVAHADSVGFPAPVCDVRLDAVGSDATGELLVRGPNVVSGYWNKPEASAQAFVDGWLHTGDLARIDDEGLVYLVDRMKDMINRGGENVYCVEVENALAGAPGVYEAAVLGVPDEVMGEKVGAVIVPMPGVSLDVPAVLDYLGEHIADFKIPQYVAVSTTPLPRNPGGKLLKRRLRDDVDWASAARR